MNTPCAIAPSVSPKASLMDLPVSRCTQCAMSSRRARTSIATARSSAPRRTAGIAAHVTWACRAAATAAATSPSRERLTRYSARPSIGEYFVKYSSPVAARGSPSIQLRTRSGKLKGVIASSPRGIATIDAELDAGDVRRGAGCEKDQRSREVRLLGPAAKRHARAEFLYERGVLTTEHTPTRKRDAAHALRRPVRGEITREVHQRGLRRAVGGPRFHRQHRFALCE